MVKGITVTFTNDITDEQMDRFEDALKLFDFVADVDRSETVGDDHINRQRIGFEYRKRIYEFINDLAK